MSATSSAPGDTDPSLLSWNQELNQTIQHLAIQNMHLFKAQRNAQRKLQLYQSSHGLVQTTREDKCLGDSSKDYLLAKNEQLMSEKDADASKIEALTSQLKILTSSCRHQDSCTQTDVDVKKDLAYLRVSAPTKACTSTGGDPIDVVTELSTDIGMHIDEEEAVEPNDTDDDEEHVRRNKIEMAKFKEELSNKREARHRAISAVSMELERLRAELIDERVAKELAQHELEEMKQKSGEAAGPNGQEMLAQQMQCVRQMTTDDSDQLEASAADNKRLINENEELTNRLKEEMLKYEQDREYSQRRIKALKDVAELSKQMLEIRENQVLDLKGKVKHLEMTHVENANAHLQTEYANQMKNIKSLKLLYEDRVRVATAEKDKFSKESEEKSEELAALVTKCSDLETRLAELETSASEREELNISLQTRLELSEEESKNLSKEISLINSTFSQMLVGNGSTDIDLDKLTRLLQENHDLITEMTTKEDGSGTAASLPKLLLDLITQIDNEDMAQASTSGIETSEPATSEAIQTSHDEVSTSHAFDKDKAVHDEGANSIAVEEIASNLPKVWKVLMELLSHHVTPTPTEDVKPSCYKCIDTPSGPRFVPSVSNTYIRLKDLILEKKSLQKDLGKLKQLNGHLESKLQEQEKRLSLVSAELRKTWGVVGRLRSQFKQLHTHEQILRYELQQKRHLLTELKNELEYCREKWERARQKDRETEVEWKKLRKEFAARKKADQNNSGESGFSDERENESGDDAPSPLPPAPNGNSTGESQELSQDVTEVAAINPMVAQLEEDSARTEVLECSEISWVTLLKLQLMFNLDNSETKFGTDLNDKKALESIFAMPPIEIPDLIFKKLQQSLDTCEKNKKLLNVCPEIQVKSSPPQDTEPCESTSGISSDGRCRDALGRTPEEALAARAARLNRLEEQTQLLFNKVTRTTSRSVALSNRLEELHEQYGVPNPPPLPPVLPALRIPVYAETQERPQSVDSPVVHHSNSQLSPTASYPNEPETPSPSTPIQQQTLSSPSTSLIDDAITIQDLNNNDDTQQSKD